MHSLFFNSAWGFVALWLNKFGAQLGLLDHLIGRIGMRPSRISEVALMYAHGKKRLSKFT